MAGKVAATLFTAGIVGVGFLAIPTLAGSAAYAFAETLGWRQGLDKKLKQACAFYSLILVSTGVGVGLDFVGINPVKALYWTAVINGLLAPFLLVATLVIAADEKLMQGQPSSCVGWTFVAITAVVMFAAGIAMFCCVDCRSPSRRAARSPDIGIQFSEMCSLDQPDNCFQAYAVSIEAMNPRSEGRCSPLGKKPSNMAHTTNKPMPKLRKALQPPRSHAGAVPDSDRAKKPPEPAATDQELNPGDRVEV